jgi:hypothetical protein
MPKNIIQQSKVHVQERSKIILQASKVIFVSWRYTFSFTGTVNNYPVQVFSKIISAILFSSRLDRKVLKALGLIVQNYYFIVQKIITYCRGRSKNFLSRDSRKMFIFRDWHTFFSYRQFLQQFQIQRITSKQFVFQNATFILYYITFSKLQQY